MYNKLLNKIIEYKTIIIHRHSKPDGDALGSQLGLKDAIKNTFKDKEVYAVGDMTNRYSFMGKMDDISDNNYQNALVIVVDCPEVEMISDTRYNQGKYLVKIDHHIKKDEFADLEYIDTTYESCCRLIFDIIKDLNLNVTSEGVKALYTGLITDSGRFRYSSTTSKTFLGASKMLEYNFNISEIYNNLYLDEMDMCILRAKYVLKMKTTNSKVAYIITTKEELEESGYDVFTISRGMVNTMSGIKGIDIWVNFTEVEKDKVYVEIRSNGHDINQVAVKYGGGGHLNASGATIDSLETAYKLLEDLNSIVEGAKNE